MTSREENFRMLEAIPDLHVSDVLAFFDSKATERDKQICALLGRLYCADEEYPE